MPDVCGMLKICRDAKKHPREATEIFWTVFGLSTHTTFHSFEPVVTCVPLNTRISIFYGARIENLLLIGYFTMCSYTFDQLNQSNGKLVSLILSYYIHICDIHIRPAMSMAINIGFSESRSALRSGTFVALISFVFFFSSSLGQSLFVLQPSIAMYDTLSLPCVRDSDFGDTTSPFSYENFIFI